MCARTPSRQVGNNITLVFSLTLFVALPLTGCSDSTNVDIAKAPGNASSGTATSGTVEVVPAGESMQIDTSMNSEPNHGTFQIQNLSDSQSGASTPAANGTGAPSTELSLETPAAQKPVIQPGLSPQQYRQNSLRIQRRCPSLPSRAYDRLRFVIWCKRRPMTPL